MSECQKFLAVLRTHRNTYAFALRAHMNPVFVDWSLTGKGETCQEEPSTVPWRKATLSVPTIPKIGNCFRSGSHPSKRTPARSIEDNAQGNAQGRVIFEFLYPLFHSPRSHTISFPPPKSSRSSQGSWQDICLFRRSIHSVCVLCSQLRPLFDWLITHSFFLFGTLGTISH